MQSLLCTVIDLYVIAVFARIILSWIPTQPGGVVEQVGSFLFTITEPVLGPVRRMMPPLGGFDLSPIVVIIGAQILRGIICG
jgi:YggT family protein